MDRAESKAKSLTAKNMARANVFRQFMAPAQGPRKFRDPVKKWQH